MPYDPQSFNVGQVLTSDAMNQVEENIRDHVHGAQGVSNWFAGMESSGSSNAYAVTISPHPGSYAVGMVVIFRANHTNTGAATLNVNGMGAVSIRKFGSAFLTANNLISGTWHVAIYDGSVFQLVTQLSSGVTVADLSRAQGTQALSETPLTFAVHQFAFASPLGGTGCQITEIGVGGRNWRGTATSGQTVTWDYLL